MTVRELRALLFKVENQDAEVHVQLSGEPATGEPQLVNFTVDFDQPESIVLDVEVLE
jgi:hypothetical protein